MAGLYIHIPFCKQACYYCDFHFSTNSGYRTRMIDALIGEMKLQKSYLNDEILDTIYFGGGTPSMLKAKELEKLLCVIHASFRVNTFPEITLEANPDDLSIKKLKEIKSVGINRLSIGIQSFDNEILRFLHRAHDAQEAMKCVKKARKTGFENLSIDLIFSIPGQSLGKVEKDIEKALILDPEHISVYSLTVEEKTVFGNWHKNGKLDLVPEQESAAQFEFIISKLEEYHYEQYEISNFCRDSKYAIHNTSYWKHIPYLGVGPGAHSYDGMNRQFNVSNNPKFMKSIEEGIVPFEIDELDNKSRTNEFLLTSLRTKWGCDLNLLKQMFDYDLIRQQYGKINQLTTEGYIRLEKNFMYLTRKGKFLADEIIAELFRI